MRILSMTATFGKLENQTLTLQPGLNIITAPNEWGKSTWCAFLAAMLYGIDTRERTKAGILADKEHYAPWSGSPMAGALRLLWQDRDITIERSSKGRGVLNQFRAFETATGLPVPELTAETCGQVLLGAEKSVFLRSGFVRQHDLPVTEDPALWRRLNALVTTGDESGAADALAQKLRDLKNRCQANRSTGLIPQVKARKEDLEARISQLQALEKQAGDIRTRQGQVEDHYRALENHQASLDYAAGQDAIRAVAEAVQAQAQAEAHAAQWEAQCAVIPEEEQARKMLRQLRSLQEESLSVQLEQQMLPPAPQDLPEDAVFAGLSGEEALASVQADSHRYASSRRQTGLLLLVFGLVLGAACAVGALALSWNGAWFGLPAAAVLAVWGGMHHLNCRKQCRRLREKYGSGDPALWLQQAQQHVRQQAARQHSAAQWEAAQADCRRRQSDLTRRIAEITENTGLQASMDHWQDVLSAHESLAAARQALRQAVHHVQALQSVSKPVPPPEFPDTMTFSRGETARLLSDCQQERQRLQQQLGRCLGQMDALGNAAALLQQLEEAAARLAELEKTYAALELAQTALQQATQRLQQRFAPQLSQRTQALFAALTGSRYTQVALDASLQLSARTATETTLRSLLWRSAGTADQLYLALRLAVAELLIPQAPVILDDALVRFDDTRLKAALDVLQEEAKTRQILLFTCQNREQQLL